MYAPPGSSNSSCGYARASKDGPLYWEEELEEEGEGKKGWDNRRCLLCVGGQASLDLAPTTGGHGKRLLIPLIGPAMPVPISPIRIAPLTDSNDAQRRWPVVLARAFHCSEGSDGGFCGGQREPPSPRLPEIQRGPPRPQVVVRHGFFCAPQR